MVALMGVMTVNAQSMKVIKTDGTTYEFFVEEVKEVIFDQGVDKDKENGFEFVDLGLPSGTMWAKYNVGASAPEESGNYYSWGEVDTKAEYSALNYKYGSGQIGDAANEESFDNLVSLTKYNTDRKFGEVDGLVELELEDDAAHVNMGGAWRMPTAGEMEELCSYCRIQKTKINDVTGYKFIGPNDNSIFLPCAGLRFNGIVMFNDPVIKYGMYWTSSLVYAEPNMAHYMFTEGQNKMGNSFRFYGKPVRAVFKK